MAGKTPVLETVSPGAAADRLVQWWQNGTDPPAPAGWLSLVAGGPDADGDGVLRDVGERVASSVLLDATGRTAEELLREVLKALGLGSWRQGGNAWISELQKLPESRLVLLSHVDRMGRTRASCEPERLLGGTLRALCARDGLRVIAQVDGVELMSSRDSGLRLEGAAPPEGADPSWPIELRALALAEPRTVPWRVWEALVEGWGADSAPATEPALREVADEYAQRLEWDDDGVTFTDDGLAAALRQAADPDTVSRVNRHLVTWLREASAELTHPEGWAANGPLGRYAASGLAMHATRADHQKRWSAKTFDALVTDGSLIAHIPQTALMDAARCARSGSVGQNTAAADAMYLWEYGVVPATQGEWAAWLHVMASARGDEPFASGLLNSGVRLPWHAQWTRWRPPGGCHKDFLQPGPVGELAEVRWNGRPAVAGIGTPDETVGVWDAHTGEPLAGPWPEDPGIPADVRGALTRPMPSPAQEAPITTVAELQDLVPDTEAAHPGLLYSPVLRIGELAVLGGPGGLLAVTPQGGFGSGTIAPDGVPLSGPYAAAGQTTPVHGTPPAATDLAEILGGDSFRTFTADLLPEGLTHDETRRVLAGIGVPDLRESGLRLAPYWDGFLSTYDWAGEAAEAEPETEGPFLRLGLWMGAPVVLDGGSGEVFRVPEEENDPVGAPLVASGLEPFLAMVAQWLIGLRIKETVDGDDEEHALRQNTLGELWLLDNTGAESEAWSYIFDTI